MTVGISAGFEADWLAARTRYDEAALDQTAVADIRAWGERLPVGYVPVVVDLGSGTGAALARVRRWLAPRPMMAYAVDRDADLLARISMPADGSRVVPIVGDLLLPLDRLGGPPDGTVDLVVGHAVADLLPLNCLAGQVGALLRPGGLAHLALAYDGLTMLDPVSDWGLERSVLAAFHRHMDRPAATLPGYGGSTAGRRLGQALMFAGLDIVADAPSVWNVRSDDGNGGRCVLDRLIRFVVEAVQELGGVVTGDLTCWERERRAALRAGTLTARVGHRDLLARKPESAEVGSAR